MVRWIIAIFKPSARRHTSLVKPLLRTARMAEQGVESGGHDLDAAESMLRRAQRRVDYHTQALAIQAEVQTSAEKMDALTASYADVI